MPALRKKQYGAAMLLIALATVITIATTITLTFSAKKLSVEKNQITLKALAIAKERLLAYSVNLNGANPRPGELPCPDINQDGMISIIDDYTGANCTSLVGWLPWRTLDIQELVDNSRSQLWYVVSNNFYNRSGAATEPVLNSDTIGGIQLNPMNTNVAALIIAPNAATDAQTRSNTDTSNNIAMYLEGENANIDNVYEMLTPNDNSNDIIIAITVDEIMHLAEKIAVDAAKTALENFYTANNYYPFAEDTDATCDAQTNILQRRSGFLPIAVSGPAICGIAIENFIASLPSWFINNWGNHIFYTVSEACSGSTTSNCDGGAFLSLDSAPNIHALITAIGKPLSGIECSGDPNPYNQTRPPINPLPFLCDYLETNSNTDLDSSYNQQIISNTSNDRFKALF